MSPLAAAAPPDKGGATSSLLRFQRLRDIAFTAIVTSAITAFVFTANPGNGSAGISFDNLFPTVDSPSIHVGSERCLGTASLPEGLPMFDDLSAAAAASAENMRWGGKGVVSFVSGNEAMVKYMLNEMAFVKTHPVPFKILYIPLDLGAVDLLSRRGSGGYVWTGLAGAGLFPNKRQNFREGAYNDLSLVKWNISYALLSLGYDAFMLDPDLVIKANPLPYLETVPACDMAISLDALLDPSGDSVKNANGYSFHSGNFHLNTVYNTGGVFMRHRPRTIAFVWEYLIHALDALHVKKVDMDDQQIFNMYLEALPAPPFKELGFNSLGAFAVDTILGGRCFEYNRTKGGETVVSIHQLNPHMFLNRPGLQDHRLPYRILQRPFWWHANWLASGDAKTNTIMAEHDWLVDPNAK